MELKRLHCFRAIKQTLFILLFLVIVYDSQSQNSPDFFKTIPALTEKTPEWARLMYSKNPDVSEVVNLYNLYYRKNKFTKTIHTQNYKYWLRTTAEYVQDDNLIHVPTRAEKLNKLDKLKRQRGLNNSAQGQRSLNNSAQRERAPANMLPTLWTNIGPYNTYDNEGNLGLRPFQVNIYCMDIAPSNADTMFAAAEGAGIWRSIDRGLNWQLVSLNESFTGAQDIKIHPFNPSIVYVGKGKDIYKSTDAGLTWTLIYTAGGNVEQFYIHRTQPSKVFAATKGGLYYSNNDGASWNNTFSKPCWDIEAHATNPNTIFLSINDSIAKKAMIYKSTDSGENWVLKDNGWYIPADINNAADFGCKIGVTPADSNRVYACLIGESKSGDHGWIGVYYSDDGADSWHNSDNIDGGPYVAKSNIGENWYFAGYYPKMYHQGWYNFDMNVSHINPDRIWVGTIWPLESSNKGASFENFRKTRKLSIHVDIQNIEVNGNEVWFATDGGINYSTDEMQTVEVRSSGIAASTYWGFDQGWNEDTWTGGRYHNGEAVYHENFGVGNTMFMGGAESATGYINPLFNRVTHYSDTRDIKTPNSLSAAAVTIPNLSKYPNESHEILSSSEIQYDPNYSDHIYLGKSGIFFKSIDGGVRFDTLFDFGIESRVLEFEVSRDNSSWIYVIVKDTSNNISAIWKSINAGQTFTPTLTVPSNSLSKLDITLKASDRNHIWVSSYHGHNGRKIYLSTDGGVTWQNKTTSTLDDHRIMDVLSQAGTGIDDIVYLATNFGVFYWDQATQDWILYAEGLPLVTKALRFRPFYRDSKLRLSSGRGIWEAPLYKASIPMAQPMTQSPTIYCDRDTVQFDCYSVLNHSEASWAWKFSPAPVWISDSTARNPRVVFAINGDYNVTLSVTDSTGTVDTKTVDGMVTLNKKCTPDTVPGLAMHTQTFGSYANIPDINVLQTNNITISAWIKPDGFQPTYTGILFNDGVEAGINFSESNMLAYHWPNGQFWWESNLKVESNKWSHVAMVVTPDSITLYLNGLASTHVFSPLLVDFHTMKIGSYRGWTNRNFKGEIDEVAFWNRSLSQEEIRELRHLTHEFGSQGMVDLVAYYQFNHPNTSKVLDRSGANHASLAEQAKKTVSAAPVGRGESNRATINSSGLHSFGNTGLAIEFGNSNPNGEVVVSRLNMLPDSLPNSNASIKNYWIVNNYGESNLDNFNQIKFQPSIGVPYGDPINAKLYTRTENEHLNNWVEYCGADNYIGNSYNYTSTCSISNGYQFFIQSGSSSIINKVYLSQAIDTSICMNESILLQGEYQNTGGVYFDTINITPSTDSIYITTLNIKAISNTTDIQTICNSSFLWIDGNTYTSSNNTAMHTLVSSTGCDSTITLDLTIIALDTTITLIAPTIQANAIDATYQWLDCDDDYSIIPSEIDQSFTAYNTSGNYAVEITKNSCVDTSSCYSIVELGVIENSFGGNFMVFPNPTIGTTVVDLGATYSSVYIEIFNSSGQLVNTEEFTNLSRINLDIQQERNGYYYLRIIATGNKRATVKILKE